MRTLRRVRWAFYSCVIGLGISSGAAALPVGNPGEIQNLVFAEVTWTNPGGVDVTHPVPVIVVNTSSGLELQINPFTFRPGGDTITVSGGGFLDPIQTLSVAFTDFGAPNSVTFSISAPMVPAFSGVVSFTGDLSGSFADGAANGGTVSPFGAATIARFDLDGTSVLGVGAARTYVTPIDGLVDTQGAGSVDCALAPFGGTCATFGTTIGFTGSGGGDSISFTSRFEVIPEPGTALLLGLGLLGISIKRRRSGRPR